MVASAGNALETVSLTSLKLEGVSLISIDTSTSRYDKHVPRSILAGDLEAFAYNRDAAVMYW